MADLHAVGFRKIEMFLREKLCQTAVSSSWLATCRMFSWANPRRKYCCNLPQRSGLQHPTGESHHATPSSCSWGWARHSRGSWPRKPRTASRTPFVRPIPRSQLLQRAPLRAGGKRGVFIGTPSKNLAFSKNYVSSKETMLVPVCTTSR